MSRLSGKIVDWLEPTMRKFFALKDKETVAMWKNRMSKDLDTYLNKYHCNDDDEPSANQYVISSLQWEAVRDMITSSGKRVKSLSYGFDHWNFFGYLTTVKTTDANGVVHTKRGVQNFESMKDTWDVWCEKYFRPDRLSKSLLVYCTAKYSKGKSNEVRSLPSGSHEYKPIEHPPRSGRGGFSDTFWTGCESERIVYGVGVGPKRRTLSMCFSGLPCMNLLRLMECYGPSKDNTNFLSVCPDRLRRMFIALKEQINLTSDPKTWTQQQVLDEAARYVFPINWSSGLMAIFSMCSAPTEQGLDFKTDSVLFLDWVYAVLYRSCQIKDDITYKPHLNVLYKGVLCGYITGSQSDLSQFMTDSSGVMKKSKSIKVVPHEWMFYPGRTPSAWERAKNVASIGRKCWLHKSKYGLFTIKNP